VEPALGPVGILPRGESTARAGPFTRRLLPDLGLAGAIFTLFYCVFVYEGYWKLFRDSDTGWHIRNGESILSTARLPRSDPYSFTRPGARWYAWEWGTDVTMALAHRADGLRGVALLYLIAIAACTWLWFRLHWRAGGDFLLACAFAAPMLSTVNLHWLARPHVFGWMMLLIAVLAAERAPDGARPWYLARVAAFTALWANLHASFFLAPLIALAYAAHHIVRPLLWEVDAACERLRARSFALMALAAAAGSLANPYGIRLHEHVARYLTDSELLSRVGEFQSFNFHAEGAGQILLMIGLAAVGGVLALGQRNVARFLLCIALLAMAMRSARALPVAALVLLPLANGAIATALARARAVRPRVRGFLDSWMNYSINLRRIDATLGGLALAPVAVLIAALCLRAPGIWSRTGFPPERFPVAAADEIARLPVEARLLAPDSFGGYLIYRFAENRKVFFDGRSDFYGLAFMKNYISLVQARPGWREQAHAFGFTHALLPPDYTLAAALERDGWRRLYADKTAVLLQR